MLLVSFEAHPSLRAVGGGSTGGARLAKTTFAMWPSAGPENIGTPNLSYAAQYLACTFPGQRFASVLADRRA